MHFSMGSPEISDFTEEPYCIVAEALSKLPGKTRNLTRSHRKVVHALQIGAYAGSEKFRKKIRRFDFRK